MSRPRRGVTAEQRIFSRLALVPDTGCWEWQGYRQPAGHGRVRVAGVKVLVHRWVWEFLVGEIPEGLELDHLCRNPPCANPEHLEPVTHQVNVLRGEAPAALNAVKTHCPADHPYDAENTRVDNLGRRVCLTCKRTRWGVAA